MKTTPWRKPVADVGGISDMVRLAYIKYANSCLFLDVKLHAYREVGTSLECAIEIHHYDLKKVNGVYKRVVECIEFKNWVY